MNQALSKNKTKIFEVLYLSLLWFSLLSFRFEIIGLDVVLNITPSGGYTYFCSQTNSVQKCSIN